MLKILQYSIELQNIQQALVGELTHVEFQFVNQYIYMVRLEKSYTGSKYLLTGVVWFF